MNIMAYWNMSYGVYTATTMDKGRPVGCIANSAMQVTVEPATIAVSINKDNYTHGCIEECGMFALSVLPENSDPKLIGSFGFSSGRNTDKFDSVDYTLIEGMPVLSSSCGHFICKVVSKLDTPTHTVFLGEVMDCDVMNTDTPMTYAYYHKVIKGRAPKNAPTYIPDELIVDQGDKSAWVCTVCSYEYDGETPFEDLPEDYVCPICGQAKSVFSKRN